LVLVAVAVLAAGLFGLDQPLARWTARGSEGLRDLFGIVTWFGQGGVVLVPCGLFLLACSWLRPRLPSLAGPIARGTRGAALLFAAVAAAGIVNDLLKLIFRRARPELWLNGDPAGFFSGHFGSAYQSFPSGHTATSVAAAIILGQLLPRWRIEFASFAVLIGLSRIVLDAHYLSDVVAGAAVGAGTTILTLAWFRRKGWMHGPAPQDEGSTLVQQ
jgi:undecaprenyl-diphosphatase